MLADHELIVFFQEEIIPPPTLRIFFYFFLELTSLGQINYLEYPKCSTFSEFFTLKPILIQLDSNRSGVVIA